MNKSQELPKAQAQELGVPPLPTGSQLPGQQSTRKMSAIRQKALPRIFKSARQPSREEEHVAIAASATVVPSTSNSSSSAGIQDTHMRDDEKGAAVQVGDLSRLAVWRKWSVFACSCLLQFLLNLDMASVAVALPVWHRLAP